MLKVLQGLKSVKVKVYVLQTSDYKICATYVRISHKNRKNKTNGKTKEKNKNKTINK
jgi:hypothetical protein